MMLMRWAVALLVAASAWCAAGEVVVQREHAVADGLEGRHPYLKEAFVALHAAAETRETEGAAPEESAEQRNVKNLVAKHPVVAFTKTHCPFSRRAVSALQKLGVDVREEALDTYHDLALTQNYQRALQAITGIRTVPQVFIGGEFFGDGTQTVRAVEDGSVKDKLLGAGADLSPPQEEDL